MANAEFIVSLTPVVLVPVGVIRFGEKANATLILLGVTTLAGLALVLFSAPANGEASWLGNAMAFTSMMFWCVYLVTSRVMRVGMDVIAIMASVMPIATLTILPIAFVTGDLLAVTWHSVPYIIGLILLTGTAAHALIVFAQRTVPVASISIMQAAQPALAVCWSVRAARRQPATAADRRDADRRGQPGGDDGGAPLGVALLPYRELAGTAG